MTGVGGARMVAPILTSSALWKRSGEATWGVRTYEGVRLHEGVTTNEECRAT